MVIIHQISPDFIFCEGEVGSDDLSEFLDQIPEIDLVYAAPPKPEFFPMWYRLAGRPKLSHEDFCSGFFRILRTLDAPEYHIEVGASNYEDACSFFAGWREFSYSYERGLLYSAPVDATTKRMAKCKNPTKIIVYSDSPVSLPSGKYSHEYLDELLTRSSKLNLFDPVIGKGLLARLALKHGHSCYGVEVNPKRLRCTTDFVRNNLGQSSLIQHIRSVRM